VIIVTATLSKLFAESGPGMSIVGVLVMWGFIMGVGVGGARPSSAVNAAEFASTRSSGCVMKTVFTAQRWRNFGTTVIKHLLKAR
jgi:MFS transporter, PHS family, inorganic phosphate transporter